MTMESVLVISGSILLLTLSILVLRYSSNRFSSEQGSISDERGIGTPVSGDG